MYLSFLTRLSVCLSVRLSVHPSIFLSIYLYIYLPIEFIWHNYFKVTTLKRSQPRPKQKGRSSVDYKTRCTKIRTNATFTLTPKSCTLVGLHCIIFKQKILERFPFMVIEIREIKNYTTYNINKLKKSCRQSTETGDLPCLYR